MNFPAVLYPDISGIQNCCDLKIIILTKFLDEKVTATLND